MECSSPSSEEFSSSPLKGFVFGVLQNDRSLFPRRCLVEALVLEVLCLFLGGFLLDEIELPSLLLEVLLGELRLGLTFGI